jgi:CheY-like chemotaxis protein
MTLNENNFDVLRLLDDIENLFQLRAEQKHLQLLVECSPDLPQYIRTDQAKLRQVLMNLLSNAMKFTREGGIVLRVKVDSTPQHAETLTTTLVFEVEDTGVGIAPEELPGLFDMFVQTKSGRDSQEGTGLGLTISRKFVQLMGGDMTVSSEVGCGTTFTFDICVSVVEAADSLLQQPGRRVIGLEPDQPHYRILVVDDKQNNRKLLVKLLNSVGFAVREAGNGQEAMKIWEHWKPHLIWMDMRMPVMDGYEATRQIKATPKGRDTLVIAVSASSLEDEQMLVLAAGCDDFLRKPFREGEVFDLLHKHLGVQFVYVETDATKQEKPPGEKILVDLSVLSAGIIDQLEQATRYNNASLMNGLIDEIRSEQPAIADKLAALADNFEYEHIAELIRKGKEEA